MRAATVAKTRGKSRTPRPKPAPHGDLAPLTLDDILPDRSPNTPEDQNGQRSFREIKDGIIKHPAVRHEATG